MTTHDSTRFQQLLSAFQSATQDLPSSSDLPVTPRVAQTARQPARTPSIVRGQAGPSRISDHASSFVTEQVSERSSAITWATHRPDTMAVGPGINSSTSRSIQLLPDLEEGAGSTLDSKKTCYSCQRRQLACDTSKPVCGPCHRDRVECRWRIGPLRQKRESSTDNDGARDRTSRQGRKAVQPSVRRSAETAEEREASALKVNWLKLVDTEGSVRHYGPMSTFAHLSETSPPSAASNASGSPENVFNQTWAWPSMGSTTRFPTSVIPGHHTAPLYPHLPTEVTLTWELHDELLDLFQAFFSSFCLVVDIPMFRQDLTATGGLRQTDYFSPSLHNAILGLAVHFSDKIDAPSDAIFSAKAASFALQECEKPMLSTIKGLVILGSLQTLLSREDLSSLYFNMALSLAQSLGLHIDCSQLVKTGQMSAERAKMREDQFWSLYALDKLWCIALGRTVTLLEFSVSPYKIDSRLDQRSWLPSQHFMVDRLGDQGGSPSKASSTFYWFCKLLTVASDINTNLCSLKVERRPTDGTQLSNLRRRLRGWQETLPSHMRLQLDNYACPPPMLLIMHMYYWLLVILVNQPESHGRLARKSGDAQAVAASEEAASRALDLLLVYEKRIGLRFGPLTTTHIAYAAASVMLMSAVTGSTPASQKENMLYGFDQCVELLSQMKHNWAKQTADILQKLKTEWIPPSVPTSRQASEGPLGRDADSRADTQQDISTLDVDKLLVMSPSTTLDPLRYLAAGTALDALSADDFSFTTVGPSLWPTFHPNGVPVVSHGDGADDIWGQWSALFPDMTGNAETILPAGQPGGTTWDW